MKVWDVLGSGGISFSVQADKVSTSGSTVTFYDATENVLAVLVGANVPVLVKLHTAVVTPIPPATGTKPTLGFFEA